MYLDILFFVFKQKTAYEMRISDWSSDVCSSDLAATAPAAAETIAITGGRIVTMGPAGEIASGTLLIRDGRIAAVGADVAVPPDATRIDASGKVVTPGLVAAGTALGLIEVRMVAATDDRGTHKRDLSADRKSTRLNSSH